MMAQMYGLVLGVKISLPHAMSLSNLIIKIKSAQNNCQFQSVGQIRTDAVNTMPHCYLTLIRHYPKRPQTNNPG